MQALSAALLGHSKTVTDLGLQSCGLTDDLACLLASALQHRLPELRLVALNYNNIGETGRAALDKCRTTNKQLMLEY